MIIYSARLAGGMLLVVVVGYAVVQAIQRPDKISRIELFGQALPMGLILVAVAMLLMSRFGVRLSLFRVALAASVIAGAAAGLIRTLSRSRARPAVGGYARFNCGRLVRGPGVLALLAATIAVVFVSSFSEPIIEQDAVSAWSLHAKVFFHERTTYPDYLTSGACGEFVSHWPPLFPLAETWGHMAAGRYDDRGIKIIFPLAYLALLAAVYGALRQLLSREYSLLMVTMLATTPAIIVPFPGGSVASAYVDVPLALFIAATAGMLQRWEVSRETRSIILAGLFCAGAVWVKREGLAFSFVSVIALWTLWLASRGRSPDSKIGQPMLYSTIQAASVLILYLHKSRFPGHFVGEPLILGRLFSADAAVRLLAAAKGLALEAANPLRWGFLWILVVLLISLRLRLVRSGVIALPLLLIAGQIAAALLYMSISDYTIAHHVALDARRALINIAPLAAMATGLLSSARGRAHDKDVFT